MLNSMFDSYIGHLLYTGFHGVARKCLLLLLFGSVCGEEEGLTGAFMNSGLLLPRRQSLLIIITAKGSVSSAM